MKKQLVVLVLSFLLLGKVSYAQHHYPTGYLNGFGGYTFDEKFDAAYGKWTYKGNVHYAGSVEFVLQDASGKNSETTLELQYQTMTSDLVAYKGVLGGFEPIKTQTSVSYLTMGINGYVGDTRLAMAFGGINAGACFINNKEYNKSATKFAAGLKAGVRLMFSNYVGLKLYGQLNTIVGGVGESYYFGTNNTGVGASSYSSVMQLGVGAGLTIGLGGGSSNQ